MKKMKNRLTAIAAVAFASVLACGVLAGCSSDKGEQKAEQPEQTAAAPAFCPSCGVKSSGEKFCQNCGAPLH